MRRVIRPVLSSSVQKYLRKRQEKADEKRIAGTLDIEKEWKSARETLKIESAATALKKMMGRRERCMYCHDSHGSDIDHFWPKSQYPNRAFSWANMLLCCTECGRIKGSKFPLDGDNPLLIDPTVEEPWLYLDFDPDTGNIVARYDIASNEYQIKGIKTVDVLDLDRREAMAAGFQMTFAHIKDVVVAYLAGEHCTPDEFYSRIVEVDDHGLRGWCFLGTGYSVDPLSDLFRDYRDVWDACVRLVTIQ
jgi:uncharacterized protein (TIGR02646 family)